MPLLRYPYLEYDGREIMRSLADALTKLRELGNLSDRENVEIKTTGISRLPDGRLSGIVSVLGPQQQDGLKKLGRTKRNAARTRINSATSCSQSFVGAGLSIRSSSRRTTMLLRVTRF